MTDAASPVPEPPWTCRLRAVVRIGTARRRLAALAVVAYAETPVGPYAEALVAVARPPLRLTVPWIVVDSRASQVAGRRHWGLPKELATLALEPGHPAAVVRAGGGAGRDVQVSAYRWGPRVPAALAAVLHQPGREPAPLRFRGTARPALVRATSAVSAAAGGPGRGAGPGLLLDGVLRLGAPGGR